MPKKIAVVFDSAGTLLNMYRAAKDIVSGEYLDHIITTTLVGQKANQGLVVFHTDPIKIMNCQSHKRIYDFLQENKIKIALSCSSGTMTLEEVEESIKNDRLTTMHDLHNVVVIIRNKCPNVFYLGIGIIINAKSQSIVYTICTGGKLFSHTSITLELLKEMGVDAYIASGDSMRNLSNLARMLNIPIERVYDVATPKKKEWVIKHLKEEYEKVVMVGDGLNDILAFRSADKSILSIQQTGKTIERLSCEADTVITDIIEIIDIVKEMVRDQKKIDSQKS